MNNIYIFKIEDFTEQDALLVKKFDKSDKVIFMPNETGMISYALFPILATWKTEPIFMQPIADCSDTELKQRGGKTTHHQLCPSARPISTRKP